MKNYYYLSVSYTKYAVVLNIVANNGTIEYDMNSVGWKTKAGAALCLALQT